MDEYKLIRTKNIKKHLRTDYYISNKGNILMKIYNKHNNELIQDYKLVYGDGIYINDENKSIHIYNLGIKQIYRFIYELFIGPIPKGYQIHHKDYNHYNNDINNLECLSVREHGLKHGFAGEIAYKPKSDYSKETINFLQQKDKINELCLIANKEHSYTNIINLLNKLANDIEIEIQQTKEKEREEKLIKERNDKLATGNYTIGENGELIYHRPKWTEERRQKTLAHQHYNDPQWRENIRKNMFKNTDKEEWRKQMSIINKENMQDISLRNKIRNTLINYWSNMSYEDKKEHGKKVSEGIKRAKNQ